jgi:PTH1 family peptidyl-tRNA hydrolase
VYLVVGLGNPGEEYKNTRHNIGFMVTERLAEKLGIASLKSKFSSFVAACEFSRKKIILALPQTFMNRSGEAVAAIVAWHKIKSSNLILIYDDVDLAVGEVRLRVGGGSAGHKGVESVIGALGAADFMRVRIGIGRETVSPDISDYVLSKIPPAQLDCIQAAVDLAADAVVNILSHGMEAAQLHLSQKL